MEKLNITPQEYVQKMFSYHPPQTVLRVEAHEQLNAATLALAELVLELIHTPELQWEVLEHIQDVRMRANQYITAEEVLNLNPKEV